MFGNIYEKEKTKGIPKMTQEDKELLLKDLCSRLPYQVKIKVHSKSGTDPLLKTLDANLVFGFQKSVLFLKPYLRPMSSMTEEELEEYDSTLDKWSSYTGTCGAEPTYRTFDFFNAHHFDYRGLIEKGLAIEAPDDMYKNFDN